MTASPALLAHIKRREDEKGFLAGRCSKLEAYLCPAGVPTIAWGHTRNVHLGDTCTPEQADAWLVEDVGAVECELARVVKVPLTQGRWDGLVGLTYNLAGGPAALPRKAPKLTAHLHAGEFDKAANEMLTIFKGGGKVLPGLIRRRVEERAMFLGLQGVSGGEKRG